MLTARPLTQHVTLTETSGGLPLLKVNNAQAECEITLFGAHVLHYRRHGEPARLWLSDQALLDGSKPIRGGIPLCWPWFGPAPERVGSGKPAHGFARTSLWTLDGVSDSEEGTLVHLSLADSDASRALWDQPFELELDILIGREISLVLTTRNSGERPLIYNAALHSYLQVSAPEQVSVIGLGERYFDKLTNQPAHQEGPLSLAGAMDRIYQAPEAMVKVRDGDHLIEVVNGNHDSVVVWNPWREGAAAMADMSDEGYRTMLCVEAAITDEAGVTIAPGEEHSLSTVIR